MGIPSRCNGSVDRMIGKQFSRYWTEHVVVRVIKSQVVARPNMPLLGNFCQCRRSRYAEGSQGTDRCIGGAMKGTCHQVPGSLHCVVYFHSLWRIVQPSYSDSYLQWTPLDILTMTGKSKVQSGRLCWKPTKTTCINLSPP